MNDAFETLGRLGERPAETPRPAFVGQLRAQLEVLLGIEQIPAPRRTTMAQTITPYLTVHDADAALAFYATAFGAVEVMRVTMPDARTVGHAEVRIGDATVYLSDEFPEMGVTSPRTLGGTSVTLHLTVADVDRVHAAAVAAGADLITPPEDQPHGARHGTVRDPFGHRWLLSQPIEALAPEAMAERLAAAGMSTTVAPTDAATPNAPGTSGGIWAALNYADAHAGIRFLVEVFGFEAVLVVEGDEPGVVEHSQLRWPEGGVVQASSPARPGNVFSDRPTGAENLYVITADPMAVWQRCTAAGVEVVLPPRSPDYDADGTVFSVRDPEGNIWSFGTYAGEA